MERPLQSELAGDVMKLKVRATCFSLLLVSISSLTAQGINPEVVRLNKMAGERLGAGDWQSAERDYLHALDIAAKSEAGHTVATLHQNLGTVYETENRYTDAEKQYRLSYDLLKGEYGEQNPKVALALNMIGEVTCLEGRFSAAYSLFQRSLDILQSQKNSSDTEVAEVLTNLAAAQWLLGNLSKAETILGRVTASFERGGKEQQPNVAFALQLRSRIAEEGGDLPRAEAHCRQALSILEGSGNTRNLAGGLGTMGYLLLRQNKLQEAQAKLERGLQLIRGDATEESPIAAGLMSNLAQCYHMQGKSHEAGPLFERAIGIDQRLLGPDHPNLLDAMQNYARFLRATKRKTEAKKVEAYVKSHLDESKRLNGAGNVVDVRQLLLEQKAHR
jgi:tetratricopeptide (TPR) repeat protein